MKEKFPNTRKPSHQQVGGQFWNLRGQQNWEKQNPCINTCLTAIPSGKVAQTLISSHQRGAGQGGAGCMFKVRTGPECPEDNLRELM